MIVFRLFFVVVLAFSIPLSSQAEVVFNYSEAVHGELSGDNQQPTQLGIFGIGRNIVTGRVTAIGDTDGGFNGTADIFAFEIAAGTLLSSIDLLSFSTVENSFSIFYAMSDSVEFPFSDFNINNTFELPDLSQILGGVVIGVGEVGTDILPRVASAHAIPVSPPQGREFSTPLGAGFYSVYIQENAEFSNYSLSFNVTAVPEPSTIAFFPAVMVLAAWGCRSRRRRALRVQIGRVAPEER